MITENEARALKALWHPQFEDELSFETCWLRYFDTAIVPDADRLATWLANGVESQKARQVGVPREPLLPTQSDFRPPSVCILRGDHTGPHEWSDVTQPGCEHCGGKGYVRVEVPMSDPRFGQALRCPDCNGGCRSEVL